MNTPIALQGFRVSTLAAAAGLTLAGAVLSAPSAAAVIGDDVQANHYVGSDRNWFNPANWSSGRVPGPADTVVLDGNDNVVINPSHGTQDIKLTDLIISDVASLETLPGTVLEVGTTVVDASASLTLRSSAMIGGTFVGGATPTAAHCPPDQIVECVLEPWGPGFGHRGMRLNPTPKSKRDVILKSSYIVDVGLGGRTPASIGVDASGALQIAAGEGHYATLNADTLLIDGELKLSLYYGFEPRPGDSFQILTARRSASGEFLGIPEGGYVGCTNDGIGFRLSYHGGDGNDVVLSAEAVDPVLCLLLPAVQKVREAAARAQALPGVLAPLAAAVGQTARRAILFVRKAGKEQQE